MRRFLIALMAAFTLPAAASAGWSCAEALYASELCPWFGKADENFAAPTFGKRWSSDGYHLGSRAGRWNDGIYVLVRIPHAVPPGSAVLWIDVGYESHWSPREARALDPVAVILRLDDRQWRAETSTPVPPDNNPWHTRPDQTFHRFTFSADTLDAMLAASATAPLNYRDLHGGDSASVLHVEILFRDAGDGIVSSNEILKIDSGRCEVNCQPRLSLAGFAEAYRKGDRKTHD